MTNLTQSKLNSNSDRLEALKLSIDLTNEQLALNRRLAKKIKGHPINLNEEFAHLGGVSKVITSLHSAIREMELSGNTNRDEDNSIATLKQVRDTLILQTYGVNTFNLVENLLFV